MWVTWREAMRAALYGRGGFYARGESAGQHFRTSPHVSARFAGALLALLREVDEALGRPERLDLVDVGAGRGELLAEMLDAAEADRELAGRVAAAAVEVAPGRPGRDPRVSWRAELPARIAGMVVANEWLDSIPLDVAELSPRGPRLLTVNPASGLERPGPVPDAADLAWLREWWPARFPGERAEIGRPRCEAWADVVGRLDRGLALAIDYGHDRSCRPPLGTMAAYRAGRAVRPIPDGSRDLTAHVAMDACAEAGRLAGAGATALVTQRAALRALGVRARPPQAALAAADPGCYLRSLRRAGEEAELIDRAGLGGFRWLAQTVGMALPAPLAALGRPARPARAGPMGP